MQRRIAECAATIADDCGWISSADGAAAPGAQVVAGDECAAAEQPGSLPLRCAEDAPAVAAGAVPFQGAFPTLDSLLRENMNV